MTLSDAGEAMRARAAEIVAHRYRILLERSKRRSLTALERNELAEAESALSELRALEPHRSVGATTAS